MHWERREPVPVWAKVAAPVGAMLVAFLVCASLIVWAGAPVIRGYALLFQGSFGSAFALTETLSKATPLIFTGLAVAVAFRAKLWNIGAEGQLYAGAILASWIGAGIVALPPYLMIPLLLLAGAVGGAVLLLVPALLKMRYGVDEVVTTLLLNFIILLLVNYLLYGPMQDPSGFGWPQTAPIVPEGTLPKLFDKGRVHIGLVIALVAAAAMWALLRFTVWGYELRAVGLNPEAARFGGLPVTLVVLRTACISGSLAALAGVSEVAGLKGYLTLELSPGYGYIGIAVAMLGLLNPWGVVIAALFIAAIFNGADAMGRALNVPSYLAHVITAVSLLVVLASNVAVRYRPRL